jgi:hypothetical protein
MTHNAQLNFSPASPLRTCLRSQQPHANFDTQTSRINLKPQTRLPHPHCRFVAFTSGLKCEIAVACGGEGAEGPKTKGKAVPMAKLQEDTRKRQQALLEMLLLDQQLWHACLSDQVTLRNSVAQT